MPRPTPAGAVPETFGSAFVRQAQRAPRAPALVMPGVRWTYREALDRALAVAAAMRACGLGRGDRVGLMMQNRPEVVELLLGAALIGAVPALVSVDARADILSTRLPSLGLKAWFATRHAGADHAEVVEQALHLQRQDQGGAPPATRVWIVDPAAARGPNSYAEFLAGGAGVAPEELLAQVHRSAPDDPMLMVFTAGVSSSWPKTCRLNEASLMRKVMPFAERLEMSPRSRLWVPLPMYQIGFYQPMVAALALGACVVATDAFAPLEALSTLRSVTHAYPIYSRYWLPVIHHLDFRPSDFTALTHVVLNGPVTLLRKAQRALPQCVFLTSYGGPESGGDFCMPRPVDTAHTRLGSVGRPFAGHELRIVDPLTGSVCAAGAVGEIQVRGPGVPVPDVRDEFGSTFSPDGWLATSDLGSLSAHGVLNFHGRVSEMLTIAGTNVSATRIEAVLSEHPAVAVAQVIGVPDESLGQAAAAFVELRPGCEISALELIAFSRGQLRSEHLPRYIGFVTEWPTAASTVYKPALADWPLGERLIV